MGDNPVAIFGIGMIATLPQVALAYAALNLAGPGNVDETGAIIVSSIGVGLGSIVCLLLGQGALVRATVAYSEGGRASFGESVKAGLLRMLPLLGVLILTTIGMMMGFLLLLVPGVILFLMWSVAIPAVVEEKQGVFAAIGRSRSLTRGARWKIFALALVAVVLLTLLSALGTGLLAALYGLEGMDRPTIAWAIVNVVTSLASTVIWCTVISALFVELREWKEGASADTLQQIFA